MFLMIVFLFTYKIGFFLEFVVNKTIAALPL